MNYCHLLLLLLCIIFITYYIYDVEYYCNIKTCKTGYQIQDNNCTVCPTITGISG